MSSEVLRLWDSSEGGRTRPKGCGDQYSQKKRDIAGSLEISVGNSRGILDEKHLSAPGAGGSQAPP